MAKMAFLGFLADLSVTFTLFQKLEKVDPNYSSILSPDRSSPISKCTFFPPFLGDFLGI